MFKKLLLPILAIAYLVMGLNVSPALAAKYYAAQSDFTESSVPITKYNWHQDAIDGCILKESGVDNSYYVWAKLAVQGWRQALREYTNNQEVWNFSARYVTSEADLQNCDVKFFIYDSYKDFPDYPRQTGAYAAVSSENSNGSRDISVYLAPTVLHGDGNTEINLPSYAYRNSALHEVGHALGLGHMQSQKGYLMSPQFDFWDEKNALPITTLELGALTSKYGTDGFD